MSTAKLIPLKDVPEHVPGRTPCYQTVLRWASRGTRGKVLPSRLIGGRRFVDLRDIEAFVGEREQRG